MAPNADELFPSWNKVRVRCQTCKEVISTDAVAAWFRLQPATPFDPLCHACVREIFNRALIGYDVEALEIELFK